MNNLITIDIGNTNIDIGYFADENLLNTAKISTQDNKSEFEIASSIKSLLNIKNKNLKNLEFIISSVVPNKTHLVAKASEIISGKKPIILNHNFDFPILNKYHPPEDVGIDRIIDSIAAVKLYGAPSIILDIGTCLVFNAITEKKEYIGGSILPGLYMAAESLASSTALLKPVDLKIPKNIIGRNSSESIQSGIIFGYVEIIKGFFKMYKEVISKNKEIKLIITGGGADLITPNLDIEFIYNEHLSFIGLKYTYELLKND
jgi:type III pantothenate kinase|tara:strand:- start:11779 stop:12558 length:780 start_codon:yes stop_codon:yes gene_type:complete